MLHKKNSPTKELGQKGENFATEYLQKLNYTIVDRNFRSQLGEIDIIANIKEYIVFVEVKTKTGDQYFINPLHSITKSKQKKLRQLALLYLAKHKIYNKQPRFDVIALTYKNSNNSFAIEHLTNAF